MPLGKRGNTRHVAFRFAEIQYERGRRMYRAKHLIGLPIVNVATGERLASVRSLVIDLASGQLLGVVVQKGTLFREPQALRFNQLHAIGQDAVLVKSGESAASLNQLLAELPQAKTEDRVFGRQVLTSAGKVIGALEDVFFNPMNGAISHYLLTDGLLQSLFEGPSVLTAPTHPVVGEEHVIVSVETEELAEQLAMKIDPIGNSEV